MATLTKTLNLTPAPNIGPFNIPLGASQLNLSFDSTSWTDENCRLFVWLELSLDGGVSWSKSVQTAPFPMGFEAVGGAIDQNTGALFTTKGLSTPLPQPQLSARRMRGHFLVVGAPFTTTVTATII